MPSDEQRQVVEYHRPAGRATASGGEVVLGTLTLMAAAVFGLFVLFCTVALFIMPRFRAEVGIEFASAMIIVSGLAGAFCARLGFEMFQGRK